MHGEVVRVRGNGIADRNRHSTDPRRDTTETAPGHKTKCMSSRIQANKPWKTQQKKRKETAHNKSRNEKTTARRERRRRRSSRRNKYFPYSIVYILIFWKWNATTVSHNHSQFFSYPYFSIFNSVFVCNSLFAFVATAVAVATAAFFLSSLCSICYSTTVHRPRSGMNNFVAYLRATALPPPSSLSRPPSYSANICVVCWLRVCIPFIHTYIISVHDNTYVCRYKKRLL